MSGDLTSELQAALYTKLTGDTTLMALISGVYDRVPEGATFPYVSIGEIDSQDDSTFSLDAQSVTMTIHTWSRQRGKKQTQQIMARIHDLLHRGSMAISGGYFAGSVHKFSTVLDDPDGLTYHGVARYQSRVSE